MTELREKGVPDSDYAAARALFSEKEPTDLNIAVGLMGAFDRLAISFRNTPQITIGQAFN